MKQTTSGRPRAWAENAWLLSALPLVLLFVFPLAVMLGRTSLEGFLANLSSEPVLLAIGVSLRSTLASLCLILLFGTPLAYFLSRWQSRYKKVLDALIDLPTVLPPAVAGVALLLAFGRRGPIGGWLEAMGIEVAFSLTAVVLAQTFIAAPFFVRAAALGFAAVDSEIEQAAQLDGASRWQVFRHIMLPLSRFALLSGAVMSWARALGEFGATIIFAGNFPGRTQTMPTAIYLGFEQDLDSALTLSVVLVGLSFVLLLLIKFLVVREKE